MRKWFLLALAGVALVACKSGITPAKGYHTTPASQTAWHNPSMPNSSGQKLQGVRSRDQVTMGYPGGGTGGSGVN
jgi:hypothetical protein